MLELYENIKKYRKMRKMSQEELAKRTGYTDRSSIAKIEAGGVDLTIQKVEAFAKALRVSEGVLMGKDGIKNESIRIPVVGTVPAGIAIEAIEDIIDYEELSPDQFDTSCEYFGLKVKGDSMYPKYLEGDTVIVKVQNDCESGQDAVVYVNGYDATLKKVIKQPVGVLLQPLNPSYEPKLYTFDDLAHPVTILGVVVELRRKI